MTKTNLDHTYAVGRHIFCNSLASNLIKPSFKLYRLHRIYRPCYRESCPHNSPKAKNRNNTHFRVSHPTPALFEFNTPSNFSRRIRKFTAFEVVMIIGSVLAEKEIGKTK